MEYVAAGLFLAFFAWLAYRVAYLHLHGIRTTGTIVELVRDTSGEGGDTFEPVVAFTTKQGTSIVAKSFYGTSKAGSYFHVGQQVDVLYSTRKPQFFAIVGYDVSALFILGLLAAGVLAMLCYHSST